MKGQQIIISKNLLASLHGCKRIQFRPKSNIGPYFAKDNEDFVVISQRVNAIDYANSHLDCKTSYKLLIILLKHVKLTGFSPLYLDYISFIIIIMPSLRVHMIIAIVFGLI